MQEIKEFINQEKRIKKTYQNKLKNYKNDQNDTPFAVFIIKDK
jgi:hypothetical protein